MSDTDTTPDDGEREWSGPERQTVQTTTEVDTPAPQPEPEPEPESEPDDDGE